MEKAYKTCLEIFEQRGYNIIEKECDKILGLKEDGTQICAFLIDIEKFNINGIHLYISIMNEIEVKHALMVYKEKTPIVEKFINTIKDMRIELFQVKELSFNITKHKLVPLHEKVDIKQGEELKLKFKFPIILKTDPISRFYGYCKGDVIKITRPDNYVTYRIVK